MVTSDGAENIGLLLSSWLLFWKHVFKLILDFPLISVVQVEAARLKKIKSNTKNPNKERKESWANSLSQEDSFVEICLK